MAKVKRTKIHKTVNRTLRLNNTYPTKNVRVNSCKKYFIVSCLSGSKSVHVFFYCLLISVLSPIIKREMVGISIIGLTLPHCYACPEPGSAFPMPYGVVFFVFNGLR